VGRKPTAPKRSNEVNEYEDLFWVLVVMGLTTHPTWLQFNKGQPQGIAPTGTISRYFFL